MKISLVIHEEKRVHFDIFDWLTPDILLSRVGPLFTMYALAFTM